MLSTWHQFIAGITSLPLASVLFVVCVLCLAGFGWRGRKFHGVDAPDSIKNGSTAAIVRESMEKLGDAGRKLYIWTQFTLDLVFPAAYAVFFAVTCQWFMPHEYVWLSALPLVAAIADYVENFSAIYLAATFRKDSPSPLAGLTATATNLKVVFLIASLGALGWCGVTWVLRLLS